MSNVLHTINIVAKRSGLTPYVIRIWERRYQCIVPERTETNRRLYTENDIYRLKLLKQATDLGCRIAQIASMDVGQLEKLIKDSRPDHPGASLGGGEHLTVPQHDSAPAGLVDHLLRCVETFQVDEMERALKEAMVRLGHQGVLCQVIAPLSHAMGEAWEKGRLTIAHEHAATAFLKNFIMSASRSFLVSDTAPRMVVGTPPGQLHELGAILVASLASNYGWRVTYCGSSVPAAELAGAVKQNNASVLALSLVFPGKDPEAEDALRALRDYLPSPFPILAGGRAVGSYSGLMDELALTGCEGLDKLQQTLDNVKNMHMRIK
jgi:DNA-binding transcriptional MerR regulator/methylmalonyl-CoA mutase cobalamin-binding subunit